MPATLQSDLAGAVAAVCRSRLGLEPGDAVLVAVSAGADSCALACLLAASADRGLPLRLVLGHLDHGWRGADEAAADRACVEALAARLGLPLVCSGPPPQGDAATEDGARRWRYRQLAAMARAHDCRYVATGHHAGDQAETFLMRLLRGSGLVGLAGIPHRRPLHPKLTVIRPLLEIEPQDLRAYLRARGVTWREDATNADLSRDRAAIRARIAHSHAPTLAALAGRLRRRLERRIARIEADAARGFVQHEVAGAVAMPRADLSRLHGEDLALALRLAGEMLRAERSGPWFTRRHVALCAALLEVGGELDLPHGLFLHVAGKTAWLAWRKQPEVSLPSLSVDVVERAAFDLDAWRAAGSSQRAAVDADMLGDAPCLRLLRSGDEFTPLGGRRRQRVAAWLSRAGVPGLARRGQVVVEGVSGVAWVVGRRLDAGHAVAKGARRVALLGVCENADD